MTNRTPLPFTQSAIVRAVKGATAAGCEVVRGEAKRDGTIVVITKAGPEADPDPPCDDDGPNEWDGAT